MYLPILTYHRVIPEEPTTAADPARIAVSARQFSSHMAFLKKFGYKTLRLDEYVQLLRQAGAPPRWTVAITFDDAYEEVYRYALPTLAEYGFSATIFAVSGAVGKTNIWDDARVRLMSAAQLREAQDQNFLIGSHSRSHAHLPLLNREEVRRELRDSRSQLENLLGKPVRLFGYPYGEYSNSIQEETAQAGYDAAVATDRAPATHEENLFALRRMVIFPKNTLWDFWKKLQPLYPQYQDWKKRHKNPPSPLEGEGPPRNNSYRPGQAP